MQLDIAYKPIFSQYWAIMSKGLEFSRIVPCDYCLIVDGCKTYTSKQYKEVEIVRNRIRESAIA